MHLKRQLSILLSVFISALLIIILHVALSDHPLETLFSVATVLFLLSTVFLTGFYFTGIRPLTIIEQVLRTRDVSGMQQLRSMQGRFGPIARLIIQSFEERTRLQEEVDKAVESELQLADREKRYRDLFETAPDAIITVDGTGSLLLANEATRRLLSIPDSARFPLHQLSDLFADEIPESVTAYLKEPEKKQRPAEIECLIKKYSGDPLPAELRFWPHQPESGQQVFVVYIRDITGRKGAEAEKRRLEEQFRVVYKMEAIGQLAGGIAHEYNNILGAISGYADLICQRYRTDERLKKYAGMILSASKRASELTRKLLIFARKNRLNLSDFDAHEALEEAIELLRHTLDKSIVITYRNLAPQSFIYGDATQFQNAVMNLALNSRDAMPSGGRLTFQSAVVEVDRSFVHRKDFTTAPGSYFAVSVADTGFGMDQKVLAHIFEPFFTTKDIGQGTGLGLASVYGTVKSHHGFIDIQSTPDEGTTFTLYFPLVEHAVNPATGTPTQVYHGKGAILFVDDESILRDAVREMLTLIGFTVTTGNDGENALALFSVAPERFDLIILDMKMPGISGLECFRKMKEIKPDVRVLLSTGYSIQEDRQALLNEGITGIIQKPFDSAQLSAAVRVAMPPAVQ